jgi:membrane associated rhomboid family serine protease
VHVFAQIFCSGLESYPLVGASGGVMGLLLAMTAYYPDSRMLLIPVSALNLGRGVLLSSFLLFLLTPDLNIPVLSNLGGWLKIVFGQDIFRIGHLFHLGGGVAGLLISGKMLPRLMTLEDLQAERISREENAV